MPEIIAISETKLNSNLKTFLPGYTFIHNNSPTNVGGVGTFVKATLSYKTTTEYQLNIMECEEIWVKIQLNNTEKVFSVLLDTLIQNFLIFNPPLKKLLKF